MIWVLAAILAAAPAPQPKAAPRQPLEMVADLMTDAGHLLEGGVSDKRVTDKQAKAVGLLNQLIAVAEKQEREAERRQMEQRMARSKTGQKGVGQGDPTAPAARSVLPSQAKGDSKPVLRTQARPGEAWGAMPPVERDRILQAIKKSFPLRYRDLVEQYFRQMNSLKRRGLTNYNRRPSHGKTR